MSGSDPGSNDVPLDPGANRTVFRPSPLSGLGTPTPSAAATPAQTAASAPRAPVLSDAGIPAPATPRETRAPMVTEAGPVLALAASIRSGRARIGMAELHREAQAGIAAWDRAITPLYGEDLRRTARSLLAATIDDIAGNLPNLDGTADTWAGRSLSDEFGPHPDGEDGIWRALDAAFDKPEDNYDLIELAHACIAAGFEGRYRRSPEGRAELGERRERMYKALDHTRALSQRFVSPQWVGFDAPLGKVSLINWLALAVAAGLVILLAVYVLTHTMRT